MTKPIDEQMVLATNLIKASLDYNSNIVALAAQVMAIYSEGNAVKMKALQRDLFKAHKIYGDELKELEKMAKNYEDKVRQKYADGYER